MSIPNDTPWIGAIHPGELLREDFLPDYGLTKYWLAQLCDVPPQRIGDLVNEKRRVTADTAVRLAHVFGTTPQLWMNLQANWDLRQVHETTTYDTVQAVEM